MMDYVETMAYAKSGGVPWHGMGVPVDDDMEPRRMLEVAGLDWKVETVGFPDMSEQGIAPYHDHKMLVRRNAEGDDVVLDVVGKRYKPIQNEEVMDFFKKYTDAGQMTMETAGSLKEGRFVWALARTTDAFAMRGDDEVRGYVLLVSPHQQGKAFVGKFTPTRVVCWNTLTMALNEKGVTEFRMRHSKKFDAAVIASIEETLGLTHHAMDRYKEQAQFLASKRATEADVVRYLTTVFEPGAEQRFARVGVPFPDSIDAVNDAPVQAEDDDGTVVKLISNWSPLKKCLKFVDTAPGADMPDAKGTWWGAFNLVTYMTDHQLGHNENTRMYNATLGSNVQKKLDALDTAIEFAEAA